ncbi:MAG: slipin family protein [Mycobacteriales bacterium]
MVGTGCGFESNCIGSDTRSRSITLVGQEIPTSDGLLGRVGIVLRWSIVEPTTFVQIAEQPTDELHLAAQRALRQAVLARSHDALDRQREEIGTEINAATAPRAAELGITVHDAWLRDVVLPVELRRATSAELVARREGLAKLEQARSETAAMRSLLNAARLVEEHPALLQLRTLQAASQPGATVVLDRPRTPWDDECTSRRATRRNESS